MDGWMDGRTARKVGWKKSGETNKQTNADQTDDGWMDGWIEVGTIYDKKATACHGMTKSTIESNGIGHYSSSVIPRLIRFDSIRFPFFKLTDADRCGQTREDNLPTN